MFFTTQKGLGGRLSEVPRVSHLWVLLHPLNLNIFYLSDLNLPAATHQTPLGLFWVRARSSRNTPGELSPLAPNACGCGGEMLPGGWEPARGNTAGRCPAHAAHRAVAAGEGKGGSCLPPITAYGSEPKSPRQRGREQVPPLPPAWSGRLQRWFLQFQPLLLFPIAFGNPTKSIPRVGTSVILNFFLSFAEEGASFCR